MGLLGNSNQTLIRHDFKRAVYRALLSQLSIEDVKEFFAKVPLVIGEKQVRNTELFELLWKDKAKIPICYDVATDNELEAFLLSKGKTFRQIMDKVLWLNNSSTVMPGRVILGWIYPKLESIFNSIDTRDVAFSMLTIHNENWIPGVIHRRIKKSEAAGWVTSTVTFILDPTFREFLDWDYEMIGVPQIMALPVMLGMPPFETFGMLADTRPVERIIGQRGPAVTWDGDAMSIDGEAFGRKAPFAKFLDEHELDLTKFGPPDLTVVRMDKDYFCPERKRIVLHAGCAYGAPLYLHTVGHQKLGHPRKKILEHLVSDLIREEKDGIDDLEAKHKALLSSVSDTWEFRYFPADESLALNGVHFTTGIQAKILKYLLEANLRDGKREFEYRELKRLFEINLGQKNSNFEVRFYRLMEKLGNEGLGVSLQKTGRGKFRLVANGKLMLRIQD